jgi:epoxyqueuosine reductase
LDQVSLLELFGWSEAMFKEKLAGSPIYRMATPNGYPIWRSGWVMRLMTRLLWRPGFADDENELVAEPVHWALQQQRQRQVSG